jgi:hypothetical protein
VLVLVAVSLVLIATDHFRRGSVLLAASVILAFFLRLMLPGSEAGFEPVAIIAFTDSICSFVPSPFVILITVLDSKLPTPV